MKIIIQVKGGVIQGITATEAIDIHIVDYDDLKSGGDEQRALDILAPDCIVEEKELLNQLEDMISSAID